MIVASLPMYDWPEIREATDAFWRGLSRHMGWQGELNRTEYAELWKSNNLSFSQTCGYPFTHEFKSLLNYVATPHYAADGCEDANYCSMIFAREAKPLADFFGSTLAMNTPDSMSGMLAAKLAFAPYARSGEFFRRTKTTGSHRNSLRLCAQNSLMSALLILFAWALQKSIALKFSKGWWKLRAHHRCQHCLSLLERLMLNCCAQLCKKLSPTKI